MIRHVTINSDLGEAIGPHTFGNDEELIRVVDTVNVACGMHAGDPGTMSRTVHLAARAGITVGAHPGLPDLAGFGRRAMALDHDDVRDLVRYQVGALVAFLDAEGLPLDHVKPHGALYAMTARDPDLARAVCEVAQQYAVPIFGMAGTAHETVAAMEGVGFVGEFYVDLEYDETGMVIVERRPSPTNLDVVARRTRDAVEAGTLTTKAGSVLEVRFESICVHSDLPGSPAVARAVRQELDATARVNH